MTIMKCTHSHLALQIAIKVNFKFMIRSCQNTMLYKNVEKLWIRSNVRQWENWFTVEPLLRGHPDEIPPPLERPLDNVNLNITILISTSEERLPLLKGHFSDGKGVASQEGFHCIQLFNIWGHDAMMLACCSGPNDYHSTVTLECHFIVQPQYYHGCTSWGAH